MSKSGVAVPIVSAGLTAMVLPDDAREVWFAPSQKAAPTLLCLCLVTQLLSFKP